LFNKANFLFSMGASENQKDSPKLQEYCDRLGDALLIAAALYHTSGGVAMDPTRLLDEWDEKVRVRIERHYSGEKPLSVVAQNHIFARMRQMYHALDEFL
jgi:hypothetical protein